MKNQILLKTCHQFSAKIC